MRFSWKSERKCDATQIETGFQTLLKDNGYTVTAYKECWGKTDYRITKDGIELEYSVPSEAKDLKSLWTMFEKYFDLKRQVLALQAEAKAKGIKF